MGSDLDHSAPILSIDRDTSFFIGGFGEGLDHPECIAAGQGGTAYAGGEKGQVYRIDTRSRTFVEYANAGGGFVGGLAADGDGNVYACTGGEVKRVGPDGRVTTYFAGSTARKLRTPNYPVFDAAGNLYVSDSGTWKKDNGCIFKVAPGGRGEVWCDALKAFPNGLAIAPDGGHLFVAMSLPPQKVVRARIERDGSAGRIETVADLPGTVPDGLAFDTKGNLYVSCYRPDRIYRVTPDGKPAVLADDGEGTMLAAPTNVAFCGENRDLFLSANLGRWHITKLEVKAVGAALHYPRVNG